MPTYQYACTDCDHRFEAVQQFTENSLTTCPECQGKLRKVFGSVGVVFKGSGFYRNDSRAGANSGAAKDGKSKSDQRDGATSDKSGSSDKPSDKSSDKASKGDKAGTPSTGSGAGSGSNGSGSTRPSGATSSSAARTPAAS